MMTRVRGSGRAASGPAALGGPAGGTGGKKYSGRAASGPAATGASARITGINSIRRRGPRPGSSPRPNVDGTVGAVPWRLSRFQFRLVLICVTALVLRVVCVGPPPRHTRLWGDAYVYHWQAYYLLQGRGFIVPFEQRFHGQW